MDESVVSTTTAVGEEMSSIAETVSSSTALGATADAAVDELMHISHGPPTSLSSNVNDTDSATALKSNSSLKPHERSQQLVLPGIDNDNGYIPPSSPVEMEEPNFPVRINMDKIRRIQSSLPVDDPLAPLGSTKNPIRIIQQGNQFITTQNLSDDQLKQILQVLKNQSLIEENDSPAAQTNSVYNPDTSTRIIFRVTNATRALARAQEEEGTLVDYRHRPRKRPRVGDSDSSDPDFDPGVPDEELGPVQPRRKTRSVRPVRPPKHLVRDYKHIKVTEMNNDFREEESDGGYDDFDQEQANDDQNDADWVPDEEEAEENVELHQEPEWPCPICGQRFHSKGGVSRHQFMKHGVSVRGNIKNKPMELGQLGGRKPREAMLIPLKRRNKLKQALSAATDEDLIDLVLPRLSKLVTPWDFLLTRSEQGDPPLPVITKILADYMNLHEIFRDFISEHLVQSNPDEVEVPDNEEQPIYVKVDNNEHAKLLHLPLGDYRVKSRLNEGYLPTQYKGVQTMIEIQRDRQRKQREEDAAREAWLFAQQKQQQAREETMGIENSESLGTTVLITDEDITSGRYLAVLNENGEPTDLVLHASSGLLYHRPTGQQVILLDDGTAATVVPADEVSAAALESGAVSMEALAYENGIQIESTEAHAHVADIKDADMEKNVETREDSAANHAVESEQEKSSNLQELNVPDLSDQPLQEVTNQPVVDVMNEHTVSISGNHQPPSMTLDTESTILDNQEPEVSCASGNMAFDDESLAHQPLNNSGDREEESIMKIDPGVNESKRSESSPDKEGNVSSPKSVEVEEEEEMEEEEEEEIEEPVRRHPTRTGKKSAALKFENTEDHTITQRTAPPIEEDLHEEEAEIVESINENASEGTTTTAVDVSQLFPGVTVTDIDENTMLIDRGDGRRIQVDHGGQGITLETFQNLLTYT